MSSDQHPTTPEDNDARARRTTKVLGHLDGNMSDTMLAAMSGVWATLEHAAVTPDAHARALRERLFWETLSPGGSAAAPVATFALGGQYAVEPSTMLDDDDDDLGLIAA